MNITIKHICTLYMLCLFALSIYAQVPSYPCQKQIEKGQFDKAIEKLNKQLEKNPNDCELNYAFYKYYFAPSNPEFSIRAAYLSLVISQQLFNQMDEKQKARLLKRGYTLEQLRNDLELVTGDAYKIAHETHTAAAYESFLKDYQFAPQSLRTSAVEERNALAFAQAKEQHTISAYKSFIDTYPQASQVSQAWSTIYILDFAAAEKTNTEEAYRAHAARYPDSSFKSLALQRAQDLRTAQRLASLPAHPDIPTLQRAVAEWTGPERDSCLIMLHAYYAAGIPSDLETFYHSYDAPCLRALKAHDEQVIEAFNQYLDDYYAEEDFIRLAAPYQIALLVLQRKTYPLIQSHSWEEARDTVVAYADVFGDNPNYQNLLRVLSAPYDNTVKSYSISPLINTSGNEYAPAISADGKTLLFCGCDREDNLGMEDIFMSRLSSKGWSKAQLMEGVNTSYGNESPKSLSADGTQMTLFKDGMIYRCQKSSEGWQTPEPLSENINISSWQSDAMITSDGRAMLFASKKKTDYEATESINLFVSLLDENGKWSKPIDLGPTLNTPFTDRSPVLHPDMKTLYFSSEGHGAIGGEDVFISTRLSEDSWTEWSEPVNLGKEINSIGDDCWYKISTDGKLTYFSKQENDNSDIYVVELPEHLRPAPVATISGRLTDPTGKPVVATIRWEDLETHEFVGQSQTDPEDGSFFVVLPEGKNYGYYIDDEHYFPVADNIDLRNTNEMIQIENNVTVASIDQMIEQQIPMPLNNLFFNTAEYDLLPASITELQRVIEILKDRPVKVEISGHTDDVGSDADNRILSEHRADAVRDYLVEHGIRADLLTTKGYGESRPVASNKTEEGRRKNRRVEIKFVK